MSFLGWMAVAGVLLLGLALASAFLRRLPVSTAIIYLLVGVLVGPAGFGWLRLDLNQSSGWLERLTEVAVIVALFTCGLKLRAPLRSAPWRAAFVLAGPLMLLTIMAVAALSMWLLGLPPASALLLGALLAPTDPVLASAVSVDDASDRDRVRFGLSGEAGLNDGMAFPFVVLALLWAEHGGPGGWLGGWAVHRLLWAVPVALVVGYLAGLAVGRAAVRLRRRQRDDAAPNDLLALALIALSYVGATVIGAWGFLAAFAAGVGLRHAEVRVVKENPHPEATRHRSQEPAADATTDHPPAEHLVQANATEEDLARPAVAAGVLLAETITFGDTVERLLEVMLMVLLGVLLVNHWDSRALVLAAVLFIVIRPALSWMCLAGSPTSGRQRLLLGWFGIRGIGSLYYLCHALEQGSAGPGMATVADLTISVVALSVLIHGASARPLLRRYERSLESGAGQRALPPAA
jgi:NhaP-type Na+/H+ or K+/H+ antiporter